jgi:hypothetical protein
MHKTSIVCCSTARPGCRRKEGWKNEWNGAGVAGLYEGVRLDKLRAYRAEVIKYAGVV